MNANIHLPLFQTALMLMVLSICLAFTSIRRTNHQIRLGSTHRLFNAQFDPWDNVGIQVPDQAEVNRWLVQKGTHFGSYRRRFDFGGVWVRNAAMSSGVLDYLQAHGMTRIEAQAQADRPYTQQFLRDMVTTNGDVTFRVIVDGGRRNTTYRLGNWNETMPTSFKSTIFQHEEILERRTYWKGARHITETATSDGSHETSVRYLEHDMLVVERIFQKAETKDHLACKEYFTRSYPETSLQAVMSSLKRVPGCVANVDIQITLIPYRRHDGAEEEYHVTLDGEADALISRGLLAVLSQAVHQMSVKSFMTIDPTTVADRLGLRKALSRGRNDGLASMTRTAQLLIETMLSGKGEENENVGDIVQSTTNQARVAVLLSGGVDSSVALNLLKKQGFHITAFYLKIWLQDELSHLGQCPWEDDFRICESICKQAGVELEAISLQEQYKDRVISYTVQEAERGRTPNPDIMCNSRVKFGCFLDAIESRNFDYVASGHYAQLIDDERTGLKKLLRASDCIKDQSYFLCALSQHQLKKLLFPIGHLLKAQVRALAEEYNLPNKDRPDSQGLCFLGKVKFDEFLHAYLGERPGDIVDAASGEILGRHRGVWYHTVGQRKGIGKVLFPKASSRGPWYVVSKEPSSDIVYASNEYDEEIFTAARTHVCVEDIHWIAGEPPSQLMDELGSFHSGRFQMKIRHGPKLVHGSLVLSDDTTGYVTLDFKDGGLAPGQFIVLYEVDGLECLGGGVISEQHWARFLTERTEKKNTVVL